MKLIAGCLIVLEVGEQLPAQLTERYELIPDEERTYRPRLPSCSLRVIQKLTPNCPHSKKVAHCTLTGKQTSFSECHSCEKRLPTSED